MRSLKIDIIAGYDCPVYVEEVDPQNLTLLSVVIIEQGTTLLLPVVQFKTRDASGNFRLLTLTGREVIAMGKAVKGINQRIHGTPEP